jgi:regulator of CtrA degradation
MAEAEFERLPERIRELIEASLRLHDRVMHLDRLITGADNAPAGSEASPVAAQQGLLQSAFGLAG